MLGGLITLGLIVVVIMIFVGVYNGLVSRRVATQSAWAQIEVSLKRRYDLIPNLVETVKGYAAHERQTLEAVVQARQQAIDAKGVAAQGQAENLLTGALRQIFALAEAYPQLKANENFLQLQTELAGTENQISITRQGYNSSVRDYNTAIGQVPGNIIASMFSFLPAEFFEIDDAAQRQAPRVQF
jgi:LemA protein